MNDTNLITLRITPLVLREIQHRLAQLQTETDHTWSATDRLQFKCFEDLIARCNGTVTRKASPFVATVLAFELLGNFLTLYEVDDLPSDDRRGRENLRRERKAMTSFVEEALGSVAAKVGEPEFARLKVRYHRGIGEMTTP